MKKLTGLLAFLIAAACSVPLASAQSVPAATNSQVRFRFFHGSTTVGELIVELFDQEKPVTVQNFLRYVREGAYDNLILHRCVPNYVIQAGMLRSLAPLSTSGLNGNVVMQTVSHEPITNEFEVGPRLANEFGTLAMAKVGDNPNSATTDWFFNLTNNSAFLDTNNGGFTVFGRVVSGTNILALFNRTNRSLGISSVYAPPFSELPVAYNPTAGRYPRFYDLYHVQVTQLGGPVDSSRPTVKIVSPAAGAKLTNRLVTVTGTASDNAGVGMVWYSLNSYVQTNAVGTTNWSATVALEPGTNYFLTESVDTGGRHSPLTWRTLYWTLREPVTVKRIGNGSISGPTNGQLLQLNNFYTFTAIPATRHKFLNWAVSTADGTNSYTTPRTTRSMWSNMTWTATFVTNPFPPLAGSYVGTTIYNYDLLLRGTLGAMTFTLTDQGAFSGKLRQGSGTYPFSGSFLADGTTQFIIARQGLGSLSVKLTNQNAQVRGTLISSDEYWLAWVQAERASTGTTAKPSRWAGRYTAGLPGGTNATLQPPGNGPATATVSSAGTLSLVGNLPDGTPLTYSTPVSTNGSWPLYLPLYGGKGGLFTLSQFDTNSPSTSMSGLYVWTKRATTVSKLYTNGFVITNILSGSAYRIPTGNTNRVLNFTNGVIALSDGGLMSGVTNEILLSIANRVTNISPNKLSFALTNSNGRFSGTVVPLGATKALSFKGVVLQNQNLGTGYFLNTNTAGSVYFGPGL